MGFKEELEKLRAEYPFEVSLCTEALKKEKKRLVGKRDSMLLERAGIPVEGFFGVPLLAEFDEKLNNIQLKISKL